MPVRDGFFSGVLHHAQTDIVVEFVHRRRVVRGLARNAALEDGNGMRCFRCNFLRHQKAGPTPANDGDVYGFEISHDSSLASFLLDPSSEQFSSHCQVPRTLSGSTRNCSKPSVSTTGAGWTQPDKFRRNATLL